MNIDNVLNPRENLKRDYGKTEIDHKEKRRQKRFIERCRVEFTVNDTTYRGLSSDFSLNGFFIRTKHTFQSGTLLDIIINFPNDLTSRLKGKVVRVSKNPLCGVSKTVRGCVENGMGIEIIEKDSLYLHFIRSFISPEGKDRWGELLFSEQESIYREITSELQDTCQLFDVVAFSIGEQSNHGDLLGKIWFEAKMKNNTNYAFEVPIVTFMTRDQQNQQIQNEQSNSFPESGVVMMSSLDDVSWKPAETVLFTGEIDLSSEAVLDYERAFIDYLANTLELVQEEPINIDSYISTLWIASPYLDVKSQRAVAQITIGCKRE
jgi:hypothetical protein